MNYGRPKVLIERVTVYFLSSTKFRHKLRYVRNLTELRQMIPTQNIYLPDEILR